MSKFTLTIQEICESIYNSTMLSKEINDNIIDNFYSITPINIDFSSIPVKDILNVAREKIFDFTYPYLNGDTEKTKELEIKILKHYYTREIGFDTFGRFKLALDERLNLIMPYFNEIYKSVEMAKIDPLTNNEITITETINGTSSSEQVSSSNTTGNNKTINQDTPSSSLGNIDYASQIVSASGENTNNSKDNTSGKNSEESEKIIKGLSNYSKQDMIMRYRENILNVEEAIVSELYDLFLLIY